MPNVVSVSRRSTFIFMKENTRRKKSKTKKPNSCVFHDTHDKKLVFFFSLFLSAAPANNLEF
jgi:hypothetical protein